MKRKFSKILGVGLAVGLVASLLLTALPAAAGTLSYSTVATPGPTGQVLQEISDVDVMEVAPDGETVFAYDNVSMQLYKSTNAGVSWTTTSIGSGVERTVVEDCEDVWDEVDDADVTETLDTDVGDYMVGAGSLSLVVAAGLTADDIMSSEVITSVDLSSYQVIKLWIRSSINTALGDLDLLLDNTASCASPLETLDIPALVANTWTQVSLTIGTPANLTAVISVGIRDDTDLGAMTIHLDDIIASSFDVVDIAISPGYATDSTLVVAAADRVDRSTNGGTSFGEVSTTLLNTASGVDGVDVFITSADVATYYTGGALAVVVGTNDTDDNQGGGVFVCRLDTWTWVDQDVGDVDAGTGGAAGAADVYAVAFSPNHQADAQIMAVVVGTTGAGDYTADTTYLATKFAANAWAADVLDAMIGTAGGMTEDDWEDTATRMATIAFPDDYEWSSMNRVLVGTHTGEADEDDVYRVHGGLPGGSSTAYDLNVGGTTVDTEVYSIAISGNITGATVIVGQQNSMTVKRTADPTTSTVTWSSSVKSPSGTADTIVAMAGDKIFAATDGADSAFSVSTDGGVLFNGLSLIDIDDIAQVDYVDFHIVDASTMFILLHDNDDGGAIRDFDANESQHLFKTTDGGTTWERIFFNNSTATDGMSILGISPDYATDMTIYVAHTGSSRIWKSTDGGGRFIGLAGPATITALTVIDGSNYFTGHASGLVYKSGHWNYGTAADTIQSIALSPDFASDDTIFVGNNDGDVYYSTNASATSSVLFSRLGTAEELGNTATIIVEPDPAFATNSTVYAGSSTAAANEGVHRWVIGTSISWTLLDDDANDLAVTGLVAAPSGALYATSNTADKGIRRELNPTWDTGWQVWESMTSYLAAGAQMEGLSFISGSTELYATVSSITAPSTSYPHGWLLLNLTDTYDITPTLTGPEDGATVGTTVSLSWEAITAPSGTTVDYRYRIYNDAAHTSLFQAAATTSGTAITITGLTAGNTYYWRLDVQSDPVNTRTANRSFIVRLGTAAQDADLSAPSPGATGISLTPLFQWGAVVGATSYTVQVADNAAFTDATEVSTETNVLSYTGELAYSTTYFWRVKSVSGSTESSWSTGAFTTMAEPEEVVVRPPQVTVQAPPAPSVTIEAPPAAPAPSVTVEAPPAPSVTVQAPPAPSVTVEAVPPTTPGYVWAIIAIGAVLTIAVIVLIVRTRRVV